MFRGWFLGLLFCCLSRSAFLYVVCTIKLALFCLVYAPLFFFFFSFYLLRTSIELLIILIGVGRIPH